MTLSDRTLIPLSKNTRSKLKSYSHKDQSYDSVINQLIDFSVEFANEREFHLWVVENIQLLGFDKVIESNFHNFPDIIAEVDNEKVRIEIEIFSGNFFIHNHQIDGCDLVICLVDNVVLPIKTVALKNFIYKPYHRNAKRNNQTTTILITDEQADWIDEQCINLSKWVRQKLDEEMSKEDTQ